MKRWIKPVLLYLSIFFVSAFIGAILLYLPVTGKKPISFIDAFYIATSAFTVTGLATVDITSQFNVLGDIVIMLLIQIGGLGIITVTLVIFIISGKSIHFGSRRLAMIALNVSEAGGMVKLVRHITLYCLSIEFVGFIMLSLAFVPKYGVGKGSFLALFTSISAFNNAGFSLFSGNLTEMQNDPVVLFIISLLIILGGLGYIVIFDLYRKRSMSKWMLHTKIMLMGTIILIVAGTFGFYLIEMTNPKTLGNMTWYNQLSNAYFQSVTSRTAGFNSIDFGQVRPATLLLIMALMFIGAGPLSAAGGVRVTTFMVVMAFIWSFLRNKSQPHLFKRSIKASYFLRGLVTVILAMGTIFIGTFLISCANPDLSLVDVLFEVVSAFGTVGLSTGISTEYGSFAKIVIIVLMMIGKIGLLTLLMFLQEPEKRPYHYVSEQIYF